jgi:hypothetical protein
MVKANSYKDASGTDNAVFYGTPIVNGGMNFRNRIINGAMDLDQRNNGAIVSVSNTVGGYGIDRWYYENNSGSGAFSIQRVADGPAGFLNSLRVTTTTADATLNATDRVLVAQKIEGYNIIDLAFGSASAKTITISFWCKSSLTGTFGGVVCNSAGNRSYPFTYSVSSASTWEYKTITVTGDTTGTWLTDNNAGVIVIWGLGVGSTYSGTAGAWAAAQYLSATGGVNVLGTNSATWQITGVQLEVGSVATPFERRPYGMELSLCQRYYHKIANSSFEFYWRGGTFASTTYATLVVNMPTTMRATPTFGGGTAVYASAACSVLANYPGINQHISLLTLSNTANIDAYFYLNSGFVSWSAEL